MAPDVDGQEARAGAAEAQECEVFEAEVPSAHTYAWAFVSRAWRQGAAPARVRVAELTLIHGYVELKRKFGEVDWEVNSSEDYIRAFCKLRGFRTALWFKDSDDEDWDVAVFGLDGRAASSIAKEAKDYVERVESAMSLIPDEVFKDFVDRCYFLNGGDVDECLEEVERIVAAAGN